jgi:predicted ABC-class ATPase
MSSYQGQGSSSNIGGGGRGRRGSGGSGRGEYYKNKYGGGGHGRGRGRGGHGHTEESTPSNKASPNNGEGGGGATGGGTMDDLKRCLGRIDGKQYGAYHDLDTPLNRGWTNHDSGYTLFVERAQSDSFAAPTRCRIVVEANRAQFPLDLYSNPIRRMALGDFLLRKIYAHCKFLGADVSLSGDTNAHGHGQHWGGGGWSGPKGGNIQILEPCQHVLEQSAVRIDATTGKVVAQLTINLPARGRTILGREAEDVFGTTVPRLVHQNLYYSSLDSHQLRNHVESIEDQCWLQGQLDSWNLVGFICNGAILPRLSGAEDRPMPSSTAIPFQSPPRLQVSFALPNCGRTISGLGIPKGVTLICGGGFHGKSTLLAALQVGVYPKLPGDGREFCVTSPNACKIRAEDGRFVQSVDISSFINNLPFGKDTTNFSTPDASGSTSQAANIIEVSVRQGK